ncbi:MAG: phosphatidate cytidylyltransferase [Desulfobacteraceae bacterium]|nr:phosphatidate cytidylyltransferase [Desulfobacteraceae bacterium]
MHLKRWLTAIVAVPALVALICKGSSAVFACLIALIAALAIREYFYIVSGGDKSFFLKPVPVIGSILGLAMIAASLYTALDIIFLLMFSGLILGALFSMPAYRHDVKIMEAVAGQVQGIVYVFLPLCALVLLRCRPEGLIWVFFVVLVVFLGDVGAFYVGTYLGRHKLAPAISPGKSVEGALGGLAANIAVAVVYKILLLPDLPFALVIVFAVAVGIAGQIGDLFESQLKRKAGIKDSGTILPGHGGMLDRIDALLFAVPVAYGFNLFVF